MEGIENLNESTIVLQFLIQNLHLSNILNVTHKCTLNLTYSKSFQRDILKEKKTRHFVEFSFAENEQN